NNNNNNNSYSAADIIDRTGNWKTMAFDGFHRFTDIDGDNRSEIAGTLVATEQFLDMGASFTKAAFSGAYGERGQKYGAYGVGLIAMLVGTPLLKKFLGVGNIPLIGLVIGAALFFGSSNMAYAAATGVAQGDDGDDETGGTGGFIAAAQANGGTSIINHTGDKIKQIQQVDFEENIDNDPEDEVARVIDADANGMAVLQVNNVVSGGSFISPRLIDLRRIQAGAQFTPQIGGGLLIDNPGVDDDILIDVIDNNNGQKQMTIKFGNEAAIPMDFIAEADVAAELVRLEAN
ncbi:MAG: hypothetical protein ACRBCT_04655, partial [Alphaproteobacteria bacterium]